MDDQSSVQRSLRLSRRTLELLDMSARASGVSRNSLADRLLGEAVRTEKHPLIKFRAGATGRRQPFLIGTRLYVHQVISTLRDDGGSIEDTANYLGVRSQLVQAALSYYSDFTDEIDDDTAVAHQVESDERARWERQRQALGQRSQDVA
jgi:uncharacterized protein (DUF433 family)